MGTSMGCGMQCVKWLVFFFNLIFFLIGCGLLALGIWLNVKMGDWEEISDFDYLSVANLAIGAGALIVLVGFLGCCGAAMENRCMLLTFFAFLFIIFLLEISAGVCAYVWRGRIETDLLVQIRKRIPSKYYTEIGVQKSMDAIQLHFHCCGVTGASDYNRTAANNYVPTSCCKSSMNACSRQQNFAASARVRSMYHWDVGCLQSIKQFIKDNLKCIGATGVVFALIEILGMVLSVMLYRQVGQKKRVADGGKPMQFSSNNNKSPGNNNRSGNQTCTTTTTVWFN